MKILVTGSSGFIGKNLIAQLKSNGYSNVFEYDMDTPVDILDEYLQECNFIFHLAGVNRPADIADYEKGNKDFTCLLLSRLKSFKNTCPVLVSSSIQAEQDNPYGKSKKAMEDAVFAYSKETGAKAYVFRLPNVFGKWCRPNYNSVVATFCNNISRELPVEINDRETVVQLVYIDNVVNEFIKVMESKPSATQNGYCKIPIVHQVKLGDIADTLYMFKNHSQTLVMPSLENEFDKYLYSTYLSYLPENSFSYPLIAKSDWRGSFCEFIKSKEFGQISISKTKPGVSRGNHWHNTKAEKFLIVQGKAVIRFRKIDGDDVLDYPVSGDKPEAIDVPPGYTHSIENIGDDELIVVIWCNDIYNPQNPDTYFSEV